VICSSRQLGTISVERLVEAAQRDASDDSPAMNELVGRFQPNADKIASSISVNSVVHDDLVQAALIALVQAVRNHQPGRLGFLGYARTYMVGGARRELSRWISKNAVTLSDPENWKYACALEAREVAAGTYTWGFGKAGLAVRELPNAQQWLLTARYVNDASLVEIASETGTTISAVSQRLATAHRAVTARIVA
jgi:RNA polymerase sigma factor (sigma-70 family)